MTRENPDEPDGGTQSPRLASASSVDFDGFRQTDERTDEVHIGEVRTGKGRVGEARTKEERKMTGPEPHATAEFRDQLLGIVGHDLRNPLGAISMSAQFLVSRGNLDPEGAMLVGLVIKSARRMDQMIKQVVEFTRARLGDGMALECSPTDLREICERVIEELLPGSGATAEATPLGSVEIERELQGDLIGRWDPDRLAAVLSILLGVAVDEARPGTRVRVEAWGEPTDVIARIEIHGVMIPAELLPILLAPYRRVTLSSSSRSSLSARQLGLGLSLAHEIVRSHGGALDAQSTDTSTTFVLRLPRTASPEA